MLNAIANAIRAIFDWKKSATDAIEIKAELHNVKYTKNALAIATQIIELAETELTGIKGKKLKRLKKQYYQSIARD